MNVDALVITLPARRTGAGEGFYLQAVQEIVDTALAYHIPRIVFTSSTSVYGNVNGTVKENSRVCRKPPADRCSRSWRTGCTTCRGHRWIFCAWPGWWGLPAIRDVFSPASRRRMASTWSIWCICRMWWPLSNCCCRPRRAGTSIIYVRPAIRRAASLSADGPRARSAAAGVQRQPGRRPGQDCRWQSYLQ